MPMRTHTLRHHIEAFFNNPIYENLNRESIQLTILMYNNYGCFYELRATGFFS